MPPVLFSLSKEDQPSIILKPRPPHGFARKERPASSYLLLSVSLEDDPKGSQIATWLKSFPPKAVKGVDIEALVMQARRLEYLKDPELYFPGRILGKLSAPVQKEILDRCWGLSKVISDAVQITTDDSAGSLTNESKTLLAENAVKSIQEQVAGVCESVESGIVLDPGTDLAQALDDDVTKAVQANDTIDLRQYVLDDSPVPSTLEIAKGSVLWRGPRGTSRFRYGTYSGKSVIVELYAYTLGSDDSSSLDKILKQIGKISGQLCRPKRPSFRILPCIGYIHVEHENKLGLVFEIDSGDDTNNQLLPKAMSDLYGTKNKTIPLGKRALLAYTLAKAMENLHIVGWLHKNWTASNVFFSPKHLSAGSTTDKEEPNNRNVEKLDYIRPWIFGFGDSRHEEEDSYLNPDMTPENNAHRHPQRWQQPETKFQKAHDVYSLVPPPLSLFFSEFSCG